MGLMVAAVGVLLLAQLATGPVQPHPTPLIIRLGDDGDVMCQASTSAFPAGIRRVQPITGDEGWRIEIRNEQGVLIYRREEGALPGTSDASAAFGAAPQTSAKFSVGRHRVTCHGSRGGMGESLLTVTAR